MEDNLINFEPGVIKGFNFNKKNIKKKHKSFGSSRFFFYFLGILVI
jgi:phage terminase large subunit